jgi:hypothetical protein
LVVAEILKSASDLKDKAAAAKEIISALNADIVSHQRTQPAVALEAVFARDELRQPPGLQPVARVKSPTANLVAGRRQIRPDAGTDSRRETSSRA